MKKKRVIIDSRESCSSGETFYDGMTGVIVDVLVSYFEVLLDEMYWDECDKNGYKNSPIISKKYVKQFQYLKV